MFAAIASTAATASAPVAFPKLLHVEFLHASIAYGYDEGDNKKAEIVTHLYMIRANLQHAEKCRKSSTGNIFAPIGQNNPRQRRRYIGKRDKLPDMPGGYYDKEIRRKGIRHASEQS